MNISLVHLLLIRHLREEEEDRRSGPKSPSLRGIPKSHRCENTGSPGADVYVGPSSFLLSPPPLILFPFFAFGGCRAIQSRSSGELYSFYPAAAEEKKCRGINLETRRRKRDRGEKGKREKGEKVNEMH